MAGSRGAGRRAQALLIANEYRGNDARAAGFGPLEGTTLYAESVQTWLRDQAAGLACAKKTQLTAEGMRQCIRNFGRQVARLEDPFVRAHMLMLLHLHGACTSGDAVPTADLHAD